MCSLDVLRDTAALLLSSLSAMTPVGVLAARSLSLRMSSSDQSADPARASYVPEDDAFGEETVGIHYVRENAELGQGARMCEMQDTKWLFAISVLMLVTVLAFTTLNGLVPYGSPAEVIKTFYSACNCGNYSVAERLLVPEANRVLTRHIGAVDGGLRGICNEETRQGHLQRVEVLQEEVHGELAQVRYMLYFADGSTIEESQGLVLKRWIWKIEP